ncbi:uncharacterized protein [Lepeophtheirus salmonis]|uniref:uncharacterized protein isoform X3 n=1 Tax=Lepeophtheirus salmonis TaxID=72036 RepID=UPI001AE1ED2F|nr:LIM domain-containing protein A-like isoform X3 [Lepeophtheirus salmonis]
MTGDESSPVDSVHVDRSNMHFRPNDDPGEESTDLQHPIGSINPSNTTANTSNNPNPGEEEDSSPTAIRLGRFKAYHYATHAHSGGSGFGDPLGGDGPYGGEHVHHHERRYRTPSGEGEIDYIRGQYSPPPPSAGDWNTSGNMVSNQIPYLEVASQHSPRGVTGGLMVSWSEQQQKFNPGSHMRAWSEHDLNPHSHPHVPHSHHHIGNSPGVIPSVNSTTTAITPPASSEHRRSRHHHHHHPHLPPDSSSNNLHSSDHNNPHHSGGSTTTSTSSLNESIPDDTLAVLSVKELNKRVQNLAREDVVALKQRRRTLKNRGYAMNCRLRRQQHKETLEVQVDALKKDNLQLQSEIDFYKNQLKNCRCHGGGNEASLELPSSAPGPPGSYPHHLHHHPLVAVHPQQLDLSVNPVSSHEDFKRIYSGGPHELKVQPNMNFVF